MQLSESFTKVTPLSKGIAIVLFALLPFIGFFLGVKYQQLIKIENNPNLCQVSPMPIINDTPTVSEAEQVPSSALYLAKYLGKYDSKGDFMENFPYVDIVIEFPKDIRITQEDERQVITTNTATYQLQTGAPPLGLCPWEDDGSGCTYTDEKFGTGTLRIWYDKEGKFALNFQNIYINGYYLDHFEIFRTGSEKMFTDQDISFWKQWINKAKTIPQESR